MNRLQSAAGFVGACAVVLAAVLVFAPSLVTGYGPITSLVTVLEAAGPRTVLLVQSVVAGLVLALVGRHASGTATAGGVVASGSGESGGDGSDSEADVFLVSAETRPEAARDDARLTATDLDQQCERAVTRSGEALETVRGRLRTVAIKSTRRRRGCSVERARTVVDDGAWTDDRLAAAFLSDTGGPTTPVSARLRRWLDPESERERRLRRSVIALERHLEGNR